MWKKSDILPGKQYRVQLCHLEGRRFFQLLANEDEPSPECIFITGFVPTRLLETRNLIRIASEILLSDGRRFFVDAHGVWFMEHEIAAMRRGEAYDAIDWATGQRPKLAPK